MRKSPRFWGKGKTLSRNNGRTAAHRAAGFCAGLLAAVALVSCRSAKIVQSGEIPADRHTPYNFTARRGMVVAAHPLAAQAGLTVLRNGGNAVDAAVATALALNAAEPFASGIGGGGFMVVYLAKEKKATVINYREKAPLAASARMFTDKGEEADEWRTESGLAVAVPGALAGWDLALRKYGTLSLAEAAGRAIEIAEEGYEVSPTFSQINKDEYEKLLKNAGDGSVYLNQGLPYEPGDYFRNPELAGTLRLVAAEGIGAFYRGAIAQKIVDAVRDNQGVMTLEDLAAYEAKEVPPLEGTYKGNKIVTAPPPASGGLHLIQLLNICENWPLQSWRQNSVVYIHHLSEALRFIFADRERYDGDPDFISIPVAGLLAKGYAARIAGRIRPDRPLDSYSYGEFGGREKGPANTTHLCVVDAEGNVVSLTQSINDFFGAGIIPSGTGFLLNDHMADFSSNPRSVNAPAPGRRPVSSMGPLIMFKDDQPVLVLGSPGGTRIFSSLGQIILNLTEFGLSLDEAIEAPRFFSYSVGGKTRPIAVESRLPEDTVLELEKMGHEVKVREAYDKYFGGAQGIMISREKKLIFGGADSRRDGWGAGY
jgi:gamma-glutamyltranspeptidase/glutathione hydrolase